jgi:hypothetical protein
MVNSDFLLFKRLAQGKVHRRNIIASDTQLMVTDIIRQFIYDESLGLSFSSDEDIEASIQTSNGIKGDSKDNSKKVSRENIFKM